MSEDRKNKFFLKAGYGAYRGKGDEAEEAAPDTSFEDDGDPFGIADAANKKQSDSGQAKKLTVEDLEKIAKHFRSNINMKKVYEIISRGA